MVAVQGLRAAACWCGVLGRWGGGGERGRDDPGGGPGGGCLGRPGAHESSPGPGWPRWAGAGGWLDAAVAWGDPAGAGVSVSRVAYARSGGFHVAYQVVGDGPVDIVVVGGFVTNLHVLWEEPGYRRFLERLGEFARLLLFDKRGMGLSDRVESSTLEERMDDVRAVMDAA